MSARFYEYGKYILLPLLSFVIINQLSAQVSISGPKCIIPGITYQYDIKGNRNDSTNANVSIKGGVLVSGASTSTERVKVSAVFITWKDTSYYQIEVQSRRGSANLLVQKTEPLNAGKLKSGDNIIKYDSLLKNHIFQCSLPTGGSCSPSYVYQWQVSDDGFNWRDIAAAKEKNLRFADKPKADLYFRRVTTETQSNTMGYSDVALLMLTYF